MDNIILGEGKGGGGDTPHILKLKHFCRVGTWTARAADKVYLQAAV